MDSYERSIELLRFCRSHHKLTCTMMRRNGLTAGVPPILDYLHDHNGCIQNELSRNCHLEPATITSILTTMERDGLICRAQHQGNRRSLWVSLTPQGRQMALRMEEIFCQADEQAAENLSPQEIQALRQMLGQVCENLACSPAKKGGKP